MHCLVGSTLHEEVVLRSSNDVLEAIPVHQDVMNKAHPFTECH